MDEKQLKEVLRRLDVLAKLTALSALAEKRPQERIMILSEIGLKSSEIAEILGLKINYITAALSNIKKAKAKKRAQKAPSRK